MVIKWAEKPKQYASDVHRRKTTRKRKPGLRIDAGPAVFAKEITEGVKLGPVSATYVSQVTCPSDCTFFQAGCYAEHGPLAMVTTKRLNRRAEGLSSTVVAEQEAEAIDRLSAKRDLRLHVVGDCASEETARIVAAAAERYIDRAKAQGREVRVWTYTHAWRTVPRAAWGRVSVLASCETRAQLKQAAWRGYASALVVPTHKGRRLKDGVLPCPEQTTPEVQCATCRLCTDDERLREKGISIGFALHGDRAGLSKARMALAARLPARDALSG